MNSNNRESNKLASDYLSISALHTRLQDEMLGLVKLTYEMQNMLSSTITEVKTLSPSAQINLQNIDRLHQTLDDLQRVMGHLSKSDCNCNIGAIKLRKKIRLRHLSSKLLDTSVSPHTPSDDEENDIIWL